MTSKLKAAGVGVTGALILLAVLIAINAVPSNAAQSSEVILDPDRGQERPSGSGPSQSAICIGCEMPMEKGPDEPSMSHERGIYVAASTLAREENQHEGSSSGDCCTGAQTIHTAGNSGTGTSDEGESISQSGFSQMALVSGSLSGGSLAGIGRKDATPVGEVRANSNGTVTPGGVTTAGNDKDVLISTGPGPGEITPEVHYCVNPVGAYCGEKQDKPKDTENPATPLSPLPPSPVTQREEEPLPTTPTEVPEPRTLALIAIGIAAAHALRHKTS